MAEYDLTPEEIAKVIKYAREAKFNGYSAFTCKFQDHRLVDIKVEIAESREALLRLYQTPLDTKSKIG
jgi:hypothetical protein